MKTKSFLAAGSIAVAMMITGTVYDIHPAQALTGSLGVNVNTNTDVQATTGTMVNANIGATAAAVTANAADANAAGSANASPVDLNAYAQTMAAGDPSVSSVDTSSDDEVSVNYSRPAKLFGFINVGLTETATVKTDSNGAVSASVHKPWWSFLASSDAKTDQFSAALQSRVQGDAAVSANSSAQLTAVQKAAYLSDINAAAQATY